MANRRINLRSFVEDVRSGTSDTQLMSKYKLSGIGLQKAFTKLVDAELLDPSDIQGRLPSYESPIGVDALRVLARNYLAFPVVVYDTEDLRVQGDILDITEKGLQVAGIEVKPQETKSFVVRPDEFHDIYPFVFEARCQWVRREGPDGTWVAGFEIAEISEMGLEELRKLISVLTIRE
ncbi:MAG: hypothetical protein RDU20_16365 [Desulfomonilaceae bacterium]|nr:hypothetical protein [Desulfomonilaceae bacterium]